MRIVSQTERVVRLIGYALLLVLGLSLQPSALHAQPQAVGDSTVVNDSGKIPITTRDYNNEEIEMADAWRANGKIYVVIAVIVSLLIGLVLFLVLLERRVNKLEKELKD